MISFASPSKNYCNHWGNIDKKYLNPFIIKTTTPSLRSYMNVSLAGKGIGDWSLQILQRLFSHFTARRFHVNNTIDLVGRLDGFAFTFAFADPMAILVKILSLIANSARSLSTSVSSWTSMYSDSTICFSKTGPSSHTTFTERTTVFSILRICGLKIFGMLSSNLLCLLCSATLVYLTFSCFVWSVTKIIEGEEEEDSLRLSSWWWYLYSYPSESWKWWPIDWWQWQQWDPEPQPPCHPNMARLESNHQKLHWTSVGQKRLHQMHVLNTPRRKTQYPTTFALPNLWHVTDTLTWGYGGLFTLWMFLKSF